MSFRNFLLKGVDSKLKRDSYAPDEVKAVESSFYYSGEVTDEKVSSDYVSVRIVDGAVQVTSPPKKLRNQMQADLNLLGMEANITSFASAALFGITAYAYFQESISPRTAAAFAVSSLTLSGVSFARSNQASWEVKKWEDPIDKVCENRRTAAKNFNTLRQKNLRLSHFTSKETQHIFHETNTRLHTEYKILMENGDRNILTFWVSQFIEKYNVLQDNNIQYAFRNKQVIKNPGNPDNSFWDRRDMDGLATESRSMKFRHTLFKAETGRLFDQLATNWALVHTTLNSGQVVTNELIRLNSENELLRIQKERDTELGLLSDQMNPQDYKNKEKDIYRKYDSKKKEIENAENTYHLTTTAVSLAAHMIKEISFEDQTQTFESERQSQYLNEFPAAVSGLIEEYESSKKCRR